MKDPRVPQDAKNYAVMVSMLDRQLGEIMDLIKNFASSRTPLFSSPGTTARRDRFKSKDYPRGYFGPNVCPSTGVEFRGGKEQLIPRRFEDSLPRSLARTASLRARSVIISFTNRTSSPPSRKSATEPASPPASTESPLHTPWGRHDGATQEEHFMFYWEYGQQVAVRQKNWKAIQPKRDSDWELYDLEKDPSEGSMAKYQPRSSPA